MDAKGLNVLEMEQQPIYLFPRPWSSARAEHSRELEFSLQQSKGQHGGEEAARIEPALPSAVPIQSYLSPVPFYPCHSDSSFSSPIFALSYRTYLPSPLISKLTSSARYHFSSSAQHHPPVFNSRCKVERKARSIPSASSVFLAIDQAQKSHCTASTFLSLFYLSRYF